MKKVERIVLKGQNYATPLTESVEITNQCVLCASVAITKSFTIGVGKDGL